MGVVAVKALLITTGSRGDVEPFIALARGLIDRGHAPALAAPARFAGVAAEHDVTFYALDDSLLDLQDILASGSSIRAITGVSKAREAFKRFLVDVATLINVPTDVVVYHPKALTAPMVAERQGVPAVATQLIPLYQPTAEFSAPVASARVPRLLNRATWKLVPAIEAPWRKMLRQLRREKFDLTTPLVGTGERIRDHGALNAWSPHLLAAPPEWDADAAPLGFWQLPAGEWTPPAGLVDFLAAGDPPVYVGFGSMVHEHPTELANTIVAGLRTAGRRGIVATGSGALAPIDSDDIFALDHAPHAWLFPRVAAVVHHGGVGTVAAALTAGTPQVIKPFLGDQHFWSHRAEAIGVAVRLKNLTPEAVARAVTTAIDTITPRARAIARGVRNEQGIDAAIDRLELLTR